MLTFEQYKTGIELFNKDRAEKLKNSYYLLVKEMIDNNNSAKWNDYKLFHYKADDYINWYLSDKDNKYLREFKYRTQLTYDEYIANRIQQLSPISIENLEEEYDKYKVYIESSENTDRLHNIVKDSRVNFDTIRKIHNFTGVPND
jgi:hypothetical protein